MLAVPNAAGVPFDEDLGVVAVAGCVFLTLSWLDGTEEPRVEVRADAPNPRTLRLEVVQRMMPIAPPPETLRSLREPGLARSDDGMAAMGLLTVKSIALQRGGTAELMGIGDRGSLIQSTFCRPDTN